MTFSFEMSAACLKNPNPAHKQKTLKKNISFSGVGVFTGQQATMNLIPAKAGHGIVFKRIDLPFQPTIPAELKYLKTSPRCTMLAHHEASVQTVEHLLAALRAYEIDNVLIEISGPEVPILDGSSGPFAEAFESVGACLQDSFKPIYKLESPVHWSKGDVHLVALPSEEYRISYTLHYPHCNFIGSQYYSIALDPKRFKEEISLSRTFSLYQEITPMIEKGLVKGGSLENGIVFDESGVMNPDGLRYNDECVRHKILDLIGDLSLVGCNFKAHIIAICSGHASNHAFSAELLTQLKLENS